MFFPSFLLGNRYWARAKEDFLDFLIFFLRENYHYESFVLMYYFIFKNISLILILPICYPGYKNYPVLK